jgi:rod shape-determining protein MreD
MMAYVVGLPLLAFAAVLQATLLPQFRLFGGTIDLVLLLSLNWTLVGEWRGGLIWALIGGLSLDLLSGGPFGANAVGLVLVAYAASLSEGRFWSSHVLLPLASVLLGTVVYHLVYLLTLAVTGHSLDWGLSLSQVTLPTVLLNTLFMLPVYHFARWLHSVLYPAAVSI